jgi:ribosomal protein S21
MMTHVHVTANPTENGTNLIRRFTKQVRGTGIVMTVKGRRYYTRENSAFKSRNKALRRLENIKKYEHMAKMGKLPERVMRSNYQSPASTTPSTNEKKD